MKTLYKFFLAFLIIQSCSTIFAQNENVKLLTYDKDGLKFEYPSDWILTNKSSPEIQTLYLSKPKSTVLIVISTPREFLENATQFSLLQSDSHSKYGDAIEKSFSSKGKKAEWETNCIDFNGRQIVGTKYTGFYNKEAGSGEIYPFALGNRFLTLAYMRTVSEQESSNIVWQNLIKSLYLEGSNKNVGGIPFQSSSFEKSVINGSAVKLVKPRYPVGARATRIQGTVNVRVLIDEEGNVISATAETGDKLFHKVAEEAARGSKFRPTLLCDKSVKVNGVIVYNFIP